IDSGRGAVVKTVRLANPPEGLAITSRGVYVAVRSTGSEHRGGTVRVAHPFPIDSIDPAAAYSEAAWLALTSTNDGLVGFRRVGGVQGAELVPDLSIALTAPTDAGTSFTFRLPDGIRY